jgi:NAD(P)H dehydrogenase (quinone)
MNVLVAYYSMYGHLKIMAEAAAEGVGQVKGVDVVVKRIPELLSDDILAKMGALEFQKKLRQEVAEVSIGDFEKADGIILVAPTRFGNITAQVEAFLDSTGALWSAGALVGKVGSAITGSATQHGGNETTLFGLHRYMLHQGMVVVGLPYSFGGQMRIDEISGCSPYGATTISGGQGERLPSENETAGARYQGAHVAEIVRKLRG